MKIIRDKFTQLSQIITHYKIKKWVHKLGLSLDMITIDEQGCVDYHDSLSIDDLNLKTIPIKFGTIYGDFRCQNNSLVSLKNAPHTIKGDFNCTNNQLTSLEEGPSSVGGNYYCKLNQITTLLGSPLKINGIFDCSNNYLKTLEYCPESVSGNLEASCNHINTLKFFPKIVGEEARLEYNSIQEINTLKRCEVKGGMHIGGTLSTLGINIHEYAAAKKQYFSNEDLEFKFKQEDIIKLKNNLEESLTEESTKPTRKMKL